MLSALVTSHTLAAEGWQKLPPLPEPNGGFIAGEQDGKVIVLGGTTWRADVKHFLTAVHAFDPQTVHWEKRDPLAEPIAYAVSGQVDGKVVWAGGTNGTAIVRRFPAMPPTVVLSAGGVIRGEFIFAGGTDDPANLAGLTRKTFAVNAKTGAVTPLPDFPSQPFGTAASATLGDRLFVFGGANWTGAVVNTADAHVFSLTTREWRKLEPLPYAVRGLTGVALDDRFIYLAGGYKNDTEEFTDEAFLYDAESNTYTLSKRIPYRAMVALVKCGDFLYCLGGEDRKKSRTDQCWRIPLRDLIR